MSDPIITPTRRQVLLTSGTVVAAAAVTAACGTTDAGSGSTAGSTAGSGSGGSSAPGGSSSPAAVGTSVKAADVPVGGGVIVQDAKIVVTQPQEGTFKAFTAVCTHQGCIVSSVKDGNIDCACHGSMFSASDGSVVQGPARAPLAELKATVSGDSVTIS